MAWRGHNYAGHDYIGRRQRRHGAAITMQATTIQAEDGDAMAWRRRPAETRARVPTLLSPTLLGPGLHTRVMTWILRPCRDVVRHMRMGLCLHKPYGRVRRNVRGHVHGRVHEHVPSLICHY